MFRPVSPNVSFPALDKEWLTFWEDNRIFEKTVEQNRGGEPFVFYEGPPTANGMPHAGHVLTRVMKDVFLRYRTMTGRYVPRRAGWDTHGLPVEVEVEKELGIHGRHAIEQYGVEAFTQKCIESVFRYIEHWKVMSRRIAFWVDFDQAYVTFHKSYVESVWWALHELHKKGLLFQDYKVVWWWPQGGTALSAGEVGQGYKEVDDPSIVVRFPVVGEARTSFLAWTTTPWTLPSNIALAVHPEELYATVELEDGERLIVASKLTSKVCKGKKHTVLGERKGRELAGLHYEPPFRYAEPEGGPAFVVVEAGFVSMDTGSGLVHVAPAFGVDDFQVCKEKGLGFLQLISPDGTFVPAVSDFAGRFCKEADRDIIRNLRQRGLLFAEEVVRHDYPFCWRAMDDPLIQYARKSWFIRTTQEIAHVIANNQALHWEPEHIQDGRMGAFLRTNVDWALSRERYWGTPLPIWINDVTGSIDAVGSTAEIVERNPDAFGAFDAAHAKNPALSEHLRVHKPWIDDVTWTKPGEPGVYRRVPEVIDCWFDSGAMPFAQHGYPHQNKAAFEREFPADFITEGVDQTRGWFYTLLAISSLLFPRADNPHPFRNCVVLGFITDKQGRKQSKRLGNYTDPLLLMEQHGADAVRWALYTGTVPGQNTKFSEDSVAQALRETLLKVWNVYSFLVTYANIDAWSPDAKAPPMEHRHELDRWIVAELDATVRDVRAALDRYQAHVAAKAIADFTNALSNWYLRRSRSRFWAEGLDESKQGAYATLYEVLVDLGRLMAPFAPFLSEILHQNLAIGHDKTAPESVHLARYPESVETRRAEGLRREIETARTIVGLGQRVRTDHKIKVRQPLSEAIVLVTSDDERQAIERSSQTIREELNVHKLTLSTDQEKYVRVELVPNFRVLGPKLGARLPEVKKMLAAMRGPNYHRELDATGKLQIRFADGPIELTRDDIEVRLIAKENFAAASERGRVVVLDTRISDALRREGLAREVINRIQRTRKDMDLPFEARIEVRYEAEGELAQAITEHHLHIATETLSGSLAAGRGDGDAIVMEVEGSLLRLWIVKS